MRSDPIQRFPLPVAIALVFFALSVRADTLTVPADFCEKISLSGTVSGVGPCAGGVTGESDLRCSLSAYENAVLEDEPVAYWRLGDEEGGFFLQQVSIIFSLNLWRGIYLDKAFYLFQKLFELLPDSQNLIP